ncbi:GNAT family N-acetyltransferase [Streptomyces sp. VRA16 Mangrove soil]|uniref:GNAT family N-acetyltransferase n=1 Tax=Streptomyces sp. VRA16 Mangrove soil TaxID=2817434 RepID=UPI001A9D904B|nr:GNAT family N-acetyltransferase [Streptomyces sp. VRA16 Mangrove soil]MBO1331311.1 GNAT family N-acetyltransferase [Streptomyces sp. VRA16 Mangrove soil]
MEFRIRSYGHPDAALLSDQVQAEYRRRFGYDDFTDLHPAHFDPPGGLFLVAYDAGVPVASGGWRAQEPDASGYADGDAELKRMFVVERARGRGLARGNLAALEDSARAAGRTRMVLETGIMLPEAMTLYESSGYRPTEPFGPFREYEESRFYAKSLRSGEPWGLSR